MEDAAVMVLQAVGASLQSLIGPHKSSKMCVSEEEGEAAAVGRGLISTDSMQILTILTDRIQHPAAHVIHSTALSHHSNHGCGVTSLVCLAASWSREIADLKKLVIPLPIVFAVFEECLSVCETILQSLTIPLAQLRDEYNKSCGVVGMKRRVLYSRYSRHSSTKDDNKDFLKYIGKRLCHGRELAMDLAVNSIQQQVNIINDIPSQLDISQVMSLQVVGVASHHSHVVGGVVCRLDDDVVTIVHGNKDTALPTIVICGDAISDYTHHGLKRDVKLSTVIGSCDPRAKSHDQSHDHIWIQSWLDTLKKYSVKVIAVQGTISSDLYHHCLANGVVVVTKLSANQIHALCRVSGANAVNYITQIKSECDVGMVRVDIMEDGWSRLKVHHVGQQEREERIQYCCVQSVLSRKDCCVTTVIICGHTHSQTNILEHSFFNCLNRLRCVMCDGSAVRGGGWVEGEIASLLRKNNGKDTGMGMRQSVGVSIPYHMETGWLKMCLKSSCEEREAIVNGFAAGLEYYAAAVVSALDPAHGGALALIRQTQTRDVGVAYSNEGCGYTKDRKVGVAYGDEGCGYVLDAVSVKMSSWRNAYHLIRTLLSSIMLDM